MNLLNKFKTIALLGVLAVGSVFGQGHNDKRGTARQMPKALSAGKISTENINNYYVGYDFDLVARYMKNDDKFRDSIAQMTILWDELYLQPEATDVEALMRMTIRGQGTSELKLARLEKAKGSVEKRLTGDARWYYNIGQSYSQLFTALDAKDLSAFKQTLTVIARQSKAAPAGTPVEFVAALSRIGSLGTQSQFGDDEFATFKAQCSVIDDIISA